ncbi:MAG TPA: outer membrane beta-barrel protein [Ferruginibacter sp.]|jgi:hypothetical protein|nr:outer membrane beta-barrel protein [Ferruginibacter sp.]
MKKTLILSILAICTSVVAIAQPEQGKFRFSIGPEVGYTTGTYAQSWNLGAGASAQAEYFFRDDVSMTITAGYVGYLGSSVPGQPGLKYQAFNTIPVKAGIRFYMGESFHIGAQLGVGFLDNGDGHSTAFAYSPIIGYNFRTNSDKGIDVSIKYDGYAFDQNDFHNGYGGTFGAVGLRLAYIF